MRRAEERGWGLISDPTTKPRAQPCHSPQEGEGGRGKRWKGYLAALAQEFLHLGALLLLQLLPPGLRELGLLRQSNALLEGEGVKKLSSKKNRKTKRRVKRKKNWI